MLIYINVHSIECEELPAMIPYANKITLYNYILHIKYIIELPEIVRTTLYNHILHIKYIIELPEIVRTTLYIIHCTIDRKRSRKASLNISFSFPLF